MVRRISADSKKRQLERSGVLTVKHESQVVIALFEVSEDDEGRPVPERLDSCSLGGYDLDGDELR